jgi:aminopeptidase N
MKTFVLFSLIIILTAVNYSTAQTFEQKGSTICSQMKMSKPYLFSFPGDSPNTPKHKFDVLDYKMFFDIRSCFLSPYPKSYTANEIIKFRVDTALNSITLNAVNTSLAIDSVRMSGVSFSQASNILTINLDRTYNPNEVVYVKIYFRHLNVSDIAFYANSGMVFTDCEPEGARYWYPCWDKPGDKATFDLTAKVPSNAKLASNGRLNDSTVTGDTIYYHWISRDPISTYLVTMIGKVNFQLDILYWHKLSNPADSIQIRFYYSSGENPSTVKNVILSMITYYSQKFGEHAFEKNGFASIPSSIAPWCGGMENQTLTNFFCAIWNVNLTSHEFAHQWFGDMITCGTWADVWLNEGFATYCEALWYEYTSGYSSYKSDINSDASYYLGSNPGWPIYNPSWAETTPPTSTLFNTAITYDKGACVLHMLRYVLQDTSVFFNCLRGYCLDTANFRYKNAVTDDFTAKISAIAGQDLTWFIDEWVKQPNHPVYANIYQFTGSGSNWSVGFQANQTQTNTTFHKMPVVVKISFASGPDTSIRVMNDANNQIWWWNFNRQPISFSFDPNADIVLKQGTTVQGVINGIESQNQVPGQFALYQNHPNPFNPVTTISFDIPKKSEVTLKIYNIIGQLVMQPVNEVKEVGKYSIEFDASNLPSGVYYYEIKAGSFTDTRKMVLVK